MRAPGVTGSGSALFAATAGTALLVDVVTKAFAVGILIPGRRVARQQRGVLGGALGNLADRVFRAPGPLRGAVVDFVSVGWSPTFNAADVCVVVGVVTLGWLLLAGTAVPAAERAWSATTRSDALRSIGEA